MLLMLLRAENASTVSERRSMPSTNRETKRMDFRYIGMGYILPCVAWIVDCLWFDVMQCTKY